MPESLCEIGDMVEWYLFDCEIVEPRWPMGPPGIGARVGLATWRRLPPAPSGYRTLVLGCSGRGQQGRRV